MNFPVEQYVFGKLHIFIKAAVTFEGFATVENIRGRSAIGQPFWRARHEFLELNQIPDDAAQAFRSAVSERAADGGVLRLAVARNGSLDQTRLRNAVRINHETE